VAGEFISRKTVAAQAAFLEQGLDFLVIFDGPLKGGGKFLCSCNAS